MTSCTIIVTTPNVVAAEIHDRMPVLLHQDDYGTWMSPNSDPHETKKLLHPYDGPMIAYPMPKAVGSPKNDEPNLIKEVGE